MSKPSKSWCFTINNYTEKDETLLKDLETSYLIYGREVGESGTPHLQGYITFRKAYRLTALKKLHKTAHWEIAKAKDAAINYCMKDQDYVLIDNRQQGARTDLTEACAIIKEEGVQALAVKMPEAYVKYHGGFDKLAYRYQEERTEKPYVTWIWGKTGVGKTHMAFAQEPDRWVSGENLRWWDGYEQQPAVILDDFRADFCKFHTLLRILDKYPYTVEIKGGHRRLNSPRIYITSCHPPERIYNTREDIDQLLRRIDKVVRLG